MVDDRHEHIVDEDPLLISQSLTYVTDEGDVLHSFQSSPFSFGTLFVVLSHRTGWAHEADQYYFAKR